MIYYDLVLPAFEGTPKNVRLWGMLAPRVEKAVVLRKLYLINAPRTVPPPAYVAAGVQYGDDGTQYVGTASGGAAAGMSRGRVVNQ